MRIMPLLRYIFYSLVVFSPLITLAAEQTENIRARISEAEFIVNICIYEQEWVPATRDYPKALLIQRAVITGVYKGNIAVGTKVEYHHLIEEPPKFFGPFKAGVEGELKTFLFSSDDGSNKNGKYTLKGDGHFSFPRCDDNSDFAKAFREELKTNPALKASND